MLCFFLVFDIVHRVLLLVLVKCMSTTSKLVSFANQFVLNWSGALPYYQWKSPALSPPLLWMD